MRRLFRSACVVIAAGILWTPPAFSGPVERITKEMVKEKMTQENVVIVDVRQGRDFKSSQFKIKGAVRPGADIVEWAAAYPKDTTFVLYCA